MPLDILHHSGSKPPTVVISGGRAKCRRRVLKHGSSGCPGNTGSFTSVGGAIRPSLVVGVALGVEKLRCILEGEQRYGYRSLHPSRWWMQQDHRRYCSPPEEVAVSCKGLGGLFSPVKPCSKFSDALFATAGGKHPWVTTQNMLSTLHEEYRLVANMSARSNVGTPSCPNTCVCLLTNTGCPCHVHTVYRSSKCVSVCLATVDHCSGSLVS